LRVMVERFLPSHSSRIDRIPVRWNHSDYRGVPLGWSAGWAVTGELGVGAAI
jgi:hypothetical protein